MKDKKMRPVKKELRILYTPEHYDRLEKQANLLDMTAAAFVRMVSMEKVTLLEAATAQGASHGIFDMLKKEIEKQEEERK